MNIQIKQLTRKLLEKYEIEKYLLFMIKNSYGIEYTPEYHYDVVNLEEYYIKPKKSNFYIAIDTTLNKIVATAAIRQYDKDYKIKDKNYNEHTASIYRTFTTPEYRHNKIASNLIRKIENFCYNQKYNEIYLHTQKDSYGALSFWLYNNYKIIENTHNQLGTIHMEKALI